MTRKPFGVWTGAWAKQLRSDRRSPNANEPAETAAFYVPPTGDEPLDAVELAIVRGLIAIFVKQIHSQAERADEQRDV